VAVTSIHSGVTLESSMALPPSASFRLALMMVAGGTLSAAPARARRHHARL